MRKNNLRFGTFLSCVFNSFLVFCVEGNREKKRIAPLSFLCIFVTLHIMSLRALQNMCGNMHHKRIMPTLKIEEVVACVASFLHKNNQKFVSSFRLPSARTFGDSGSCPSSTIVALQLDVIPHR